MCHVTLQHPLSRTETCLDVSVVIARAIACNCLVPEVRVGRADRSFSSMSLLFVGLTRT
jgi:hypothetical protein